MTLTLLHKRVKFAENMSIDILASIFMVVMGIQAFITHSSKWHSFLCPHF